MIKIKAIAFYGLIEYMESAVKHRYQQCQRIYSIKRIIKTFRALRINCEIQMRKRYYKMKKLTKYFKSFRKAVQISKFEQEIIDKAADISFKKFNLQRFTKNVK